MEGKYRGRRTEEGNQLTDAKQKEGTLKKEAVGENQ